MRPRAQAQAQFQALVRVFDFGLGVAGSVARAITLKHSEAIARTSPHAHLLSVPFGAPRWCLCRRAVSRANGTWGRVSACSSGERLGRTTLALKREDTARQSNDSGGSTAWQYSP